MIRKTTNVPEYIEDMEDAEKSLAYSWRVLYIAPHKKYDQTMRGGRFAYAPCCRQRGRKF
jgi:hypothetical protein